MSILQRTIESSVAVRSRQSILLGGLIEQTQLGLGIGLYVSVIVDLNMRDHSMVRSLARRIFSDP